MTRRRDGDPKYPSDKLDYALWFGCGAVFGLLIAAACFFLVAEEFRTLVLIGGALLTLGCGLLSGWLRGGFWGLIRDLFRI